MKEQTRRRNLTLDFMAKVAEAHADRSKNEAERSEHKANAKAYRASKS